MAIGYWPTSYFQTAKKKVIIALNSAGFFPKNIPIQSMDKTRRVDFADQNEESRFCWSPV